VARVQSDCRGTHHATGYTAHAVDGSGHAAHAAHDNRGGLMADQIYLRQVGDTVSALACTLQQLSVAGVATAVNLTGKTVEVRMVDEHGVDKISQTSTGVTVTTAASGEVQYDFPSGGVDTAGRFYFYWIVTTSGETETFPVEPRELIICIGDVA